MELLGLIINLLSGAAGGNIAGALLKERSLGTLGNSLAGIFGGGIGSSVLQTLGLLSPLVVGGEAGIDVGNILANIASSGVGGAVLLLIISFIKGIIK